jgi:hypothetical protein
MRFRIDALPLDDLPFDAVWALDLNDLSFSGQVLLGALVLASYSGVVDAASYLHQPLLPPEKRKIILTAGPREAYVWAKIYFGLGCVTWWFGC